MRRTQIDPMWYVRRRLVGEEAGMRPAIRRVGMDSTYRLFLAAVGRDDVAVAAQYAAALRAGLDQGDEPSWSADGKQQFSQWCAVHKASETA